MIIVTVNDENNEESDNNEQKKAVAWMNRVMKQLDCDSDDRHNNAHEDIVAKYEMPRRGGFVHNCRREKDMHTHIITRNCTYAFVDDCIIFFFVDVITSFVTRKCGR